MRTLLCTMHRWFSAILSYLKKSDFFSLLPFHIKNQSFPHNCIEIAQFATKFESLSLKFSQALPNFNILFSPKDEVDSYHNILLNQRYTTADVLQELVKGEILIA